MNLLSRLEAHIIAENRRKSCEILMIYLGDLVGRGPAFAPVIEHCLVPSSEGFRRLVRCGNYDETFVDFSSSRYFKITGLVLAGVKRSLLMTLILKVPGYKLWMSERLPG